MIHDDPSTINNYNRFNFVKTKYNNGKVSCKGKKNMTMFSIASMFTLGKLLVDFTLLLL